jgi:hypothetical protein
VDTGEALAVLGLSSGAAMTDVRAAYRRLVREHHPDLAGHTGSGQTVRLTEAYAHLRRVAQDAGSDTIEVDQPPSQARADPTPPPPRPTPTPYEAAVAAERAAGDTIIVRAPFSEAFGVLFEAAGRIGHLAYFDRELGILETIVRFEGGPSCSLLITLQGRVGGTEAFCTLESIEATPTPPIQPVIEALFEELTARR